MESKLIFEGQGQKTYAVVFDKGEELISGLKSFAEGQSLDSSHFTAIGAFSNAILGYFDRQIMDYKRIPVNEQVEVLSMVGNIALDNGKPKIHVHVVLGKSDASAMGGHILEAHIWPTLEVVIEETPQHLKRKFDPETGLALLDLGGN